MDDLKYEKIGEVNGRWKAEIIETLLESNGVDVELIQEAATHYLYKSAYDLVQVFVPASEVIRARELLGSFEEFQEEDNDGE